MHLGVSRMNLENFLYRLHFDTENARPSDLEVDWGMRHYHTSCTGGNLSFHYLKMCLYRS